MNRVYHFLIACALLATSASAWAQTAAYPSRPVRIVVGFPPGGATDVAARAVSQKLSESLGQPVVVENRAGAASNIAADHVAKSAADGYTVLMGTISLAINPTLHQKLTYDPLTELAAVVQVSSAPFLLVVNPSVPINSVRELIAAAKAKPRTINYATAGNGSGSHLFTELFASMAGVELVHVPYKGAAPAMNDVLGGQVPLTFDNIITTLPLVKAGKLKALAVSTATRSQVGPDIATLAESGVPGYDANSWFGLFVPVATPRAIVQRLNADTVQALKDKTIRERLLAVGAEPVGSTVEEFAAFYRAEVAKWGAVVRRAKVRVE